MNKNPLEAIEPMPETDAPKMEYVKFAVPANLLDDAIEMAKSEGWKPAELHRIFWEKGFAAHAEGSNKRAVNRKLRREERLADEQDQSEK